MIDPRLGNPNGPVVINSFVMPNCMPTSLTQGPGNNFLVGCADHDGEAFPPNEYVIDGTSGAILAEILNVGGVDEVWYNSGDNKYYLAARDMPNGPVHGRHRRRDQHLAAKRHHRFQLSQHVGGLEQ